MLLYNLLVPVVYGLTALGTYDNVVKPMAKASWDTSIVVYERSVEVLKEITAEEAE